MVAAEMSAGGLHFACQESFTVGMHLPGQLGASCNQHAVISYGTQKQCPQCQCWGASAYLSTNFYHSLKLEGWPLSVQISGGGSFEEEQLS